MVLDDLKEKLGDAYERNKEALSLAEDSTEGKSKEQLDEEKQEKLEILSKKVENELVNAWENENWEKAEEIASRLDMGIEKYQNMLNTYIDAKEKTAQSKLTIIETQLEQCQEHLKIAKRNFKAGRTRQVKETLKRAIKKYNKIDKDEILEVQRDFSHAENAIGHYSDKRPSKQKRKDRRIHKDINQLDKDVKKAEEDIKAIKIELQKVDLDSL